MHVHVVHRDWGVGRNNPVLIPNRCIGRNARHAADDAVGHAETFFDDSAQVWETLQIPPLGQNVNVGNSGRQFGRQTLKNVRSVEDMEGHDRQGVSGGLVTGHDE